METNPSSTAEPVEIAGRAERTAPAGRNMTGRAEAADQTARAASPTAAAAAGKPDGPPRDLFGRPVTRHRGTDIDGATLAPDEALRVRGMDLNALIGATSFEGALAHLWFDVEPGAAGHAGHELALRARLAELSGALLPGSAAQTVAAEMGAAGVAPVFAAAAGLLRGLDDAWARVATPSPFDADLEAMLGSAAAAPFLLRAAIEGSPFAAGARADDVVAFDAGSTHARRMLALTGARRHDARAEQTMDALLVAWHAGFGYITPTVLAPRVAIGTGITLSQAVAAGFMASGPSHVGAALEAMQWLAALADTVSAQRSPAALEAAARAAIDAALEARQTLYGFGHPLFTADPRPPHLRRLLGEFGLDGGPYLSLFDASCEHAAARRGLRPNIDFLTATALLELGVEAPSWGVGVGLGARIAAMCAHAVERRQRPAFGVNSATARRLLAAVPAGWL
ncbi:citrate/2-methylcitrate synthase [Burkholderia gladioli]|uniref:citrate/2-methylcitrate synthase n=1 Tax=Burkholderia gladioli TaxID=28095 RepID=UPI0023633B94|nr:citrate/2-methylcitrate synthase [Burkholderia gladioli]MDD1784715.1 citrate/2-methylcitrate synthase [Burkholderia gladioli]